MIFRSKAHLRVDQPRREEGDGEAEDDDVADPHELGVDETFLD